MMAAGILTVGFMLIAGVFPVGVKLTEISTERTIASVAADEALAKIRLWLDDVDKTDPNDPVAARAQQTPLGDILIGTPHELYQDDMAYPSVDTGLEEKRYYWSAVCRLTQNDEMQATVFISRKIGTGAKYRNPNDPTNETIPYPMVVNVPVAFNDTGPPRLLTVTDEYEDFINEGDIITADGTGILYRVFERDDMTITLDTPWLEDGDGAIADDFESYIDNSAMQDKWGFTPTLCEVPVNVHAGLKSMQVDYDSSDTIRTNLGSSEFGGFVDTVSIWFKGNIAASVTLTALGTDGLTEVGNATEIGDGGWKQVTVSVNPDSIVRDVEIKISAPATGTMYFDDLSLATSSVWVVPPAVDGMKRPCVGVYQKTFKF